MRKSLLYRFLYFIIFLTLFENSNSEPTKNESYPSFAKLSNWGYDFCFSVPTCNDEYSGVNNKIKVRIISFDTTLITLKAGKGYFITRKVLPYIPNEIELNPDVANVYVKSPQSPASASKIYPGAITIESEKLISVSVIVDYYKTGESFLVYPVDLLSKEYSLTGYEDTSEDFALNYYPSEVNISSFYSNNKITIYGSKDLILNTGIDSGDSITYATLNKSEVYLISTHNRKGDLSGFTINSEKPVCIVSGSQNTNVPKGVGPGDYLAECIIPVDLAGKSFVVPVFAGRRTAPLIRVYSKYSNTRVYKDGVLQGEINTASPNNKYFMEFRNNSLAPMVITTNNPAQLAIFNTGVSEDGNPTPLGGPFQLNSPPINLYQNDVVFDVEQSNKLDDKTYLGLIFESNDNFINFKENVLTYFENGIAKKIDISYLNPVFDYNINDVQTGKKYKCLAYQLNNAGVYRLTSPYSFTSFIYGYSEGTGRAKQASISLKRYLPSDIYPPKVTYTTNCGKVEGQVEDMPEDASIRSNLAAPIYNSINSYNYDADFPGDENKINFTLTPRQPLQDAHAEITFRDKAGNDTLIIFDYKAPSVSLYPSTNFGSVKKGSVIEKEFVLTNTSKYPILIKAIKLFDALNKFKITYFSADTILAAGASTKFKVTFTADSSGDFIAKLVADTDCNFAFFDLGYLTAKVGSPEIQTPDINIGAIVVNSTRQFKSYTKNTGKANLQIFGYKAPVSAELKFNINKIPTIDNPVLLTPGASLDFDVIYTPTTQGKLVDSVVFYSDALSIDSVCYINANIIAPGLSSRNYDWNRKKIDRPAFPNGPYNASSGELLIENLGSATLYVMKAELDYADEKNKNAFIIDLSPFNNLTLKPGDKYPITASFAPKDTGFYSIKIIFTDDRGNQSVSYLQGTGVAPTYECSGSNLGYFDPKSSTSSTKGHIYIHCKSLSENIYTDTLTIFKILDQKSDSPIKINEFGTKGFKINYSGTYPILLPPGEDLDLIVEFFSINEEILKENYCPITDALNSSCGDISIISTSTRVSFTGDENYNACLGDSAIALVTVKNEGLTALNSNGLLLEPSSDEFYLINKEFEKPFVLAPGESKVVKFLFAPKEVKTVVRSLKITGPDSKAFDTLLIKTEVKFIERVPYIKPVNQEVSIGDKIDLSLFLSSGEDINFAAIKEAEVKIHYTNDFLNPIPESINLNESFAKDFIMTGLVVKPGEISFILKSKNDKYINAEGQIANFGFDVIGGSTLDLTCDVQSKITISPTKCVVLKSSQALVTLNPDCAYNLRKFKSSGVNYQINSVKQIGDELKIFFSIGISANANLMLFNSRGELVKTILNEEIKSGSYESSLNISDLSTGLYFIKLDSGPFHELMKAFIIK